MQLELSIALFACILAAISDVRTRRIPNVIPLAVVLATLGFALPHGAVTVLTAIALTVMTMLVGTLAFARGWLGGGDVKLLAAVTGCLGLADALPFLMYTAISGGLIALCLALLTRRLPSVVRSTLNIVRPLAFDGTVAIAPARPIMMPYALAIASGVIVVALSHSIAPFLRLPL
jgi:prepilin peptidase CpaA